MNKLFSLFFIVSFSFLFAQKGPTEIRTEFDENSLSQVVYDLEGNEISIGEILESHKGKVVFLYIWATWCPDCIIGFPQLKEVQAEYPDAVYLFLSLDRVGKEKVWKDGVKKWDLQGEHYWFNTEWKNKFTDYIGLNWIPRYMIIDKEGKIAHYYAVKADEPDLVQSLSNALSK